MKNSTKVFNFAFGKANDELVPKDLAYTATKHTYERIEDVYYNSN